MQKIIASYLVQKKECYLPNLGHFKVIATPAESDIPNKQLLPPADYVSFDKDEGHLRKDLVEYVAGHRQINENEAAEKISRWCEEINQKLDAGEKIYFLSLGTLEKSPSGDIYFETKNETDLFEPVPAERVIHKNEDHAVLVGDRETTSGVMNEFFKLTSINTKRSSWKLLAIVLFAMAVLILIIHFSTHSFSLSGIGRQVHLSAPQAPATYELK